MTIVPSQSAAPTARLQLAIHGAVQGVGFRPFIYRLATELGLAGWVNNSPQGVCVEVEGARAELDQFQNRLATEKPLRSFIQGCEATWLNPIGHNGFVIHPSDNAGATTAIVLPDIATCPDCRREIADPTNRHHRYPFTNCTNCGPRFSILAALPYDRANTSMRGFSMCRECQAEYDNPHDRRFHAQPNACPVCGPQLELWPGNPVNVARRDTDEPPRRLAHRHDALLAAAHVIRCGQIVAVKGIGGFHLFVDARNEVAVKRLRERKQRAEKPFALVFPSLASVKEVCEVSPLEARLLCSPEAPIVLLQRLDVNFHPGPLSQEREKCFPLSDQSAIVDRSHADRANGTADYSPHSPRERAEIRASIGQSPIQLAASVALNNPNLGVMLPSNPLHHLLMAELGFPVVATSGNLSDEPICTDELEAFTRLAGIADVFLVHNRPILRPLDDSIVRVMRDGEVVLRCARGYAPLPFRLPVAAEMGRLKSKNESQFELPDGGGETVLAVGAHLKNSVALSVNEQIFISQHIGDLETEPANRAFRCAVADLPRLYEATPGVIAADLHPDYLSTRFALERQPPTRSGPDSAEPEGGGSEIAAPRIIQVQHHIAHVLSCLAENRVTLPVLGVAWDGTGYGTDGTIWGGEFFTVTEATIERVVHLRPFRLPGGDAAVREPRRTALGILHELCGDRVTECKGLPTVAAFTETELAVVKRMLEQGLNTPWCSSMGRLFDAVASLAGVRQQTHFEGQAAMELEFALPRVATDEAYHFPLVARGGSLVLDWSPMMEALLFDVKRALPASEISAKFHNALVEAIVQVAKGLAGDRVALSGGCFQNRYLLEHSVLRLQAEGFEPCWHHRVPPNDGGIALGQIVAAHRELRSRGRKPTQTQPLPRPEERRLTAAVMTI